jgi:hypothetical protein
MSTGKVIPWHACLIWVWDAEDGWTATGEPIGERAASKEVRELADHGVRAKALPLGMKPLAPAHVFTPAVKTP